MNILITGGRAPAALEIARAFNNAGHSVYIAESSQNHLSRPSKAITANFHVPAPRQETSNFIKSIRKIIIEQNIDILIPTCEEVFYISMGLPDFPCKVFVEPLEKLEILHNKYKFILLAESIGLPVPKTLLYENKDQLGQLRKLWPEIVLKPIYSRFADRTLIHPTTEQMATALEILPRVLWAAQEFVLGKQICTYSVCHQGNISAHTAYPANFTAGQGAAIVFEHINHAAIFEWVKTFVQSIEYTGQIAFDFIETSNHKIFALECNPRATSGAHLLASNSKFPESFLNSNTRDILPVINNQSLMLSTAMLIYGLPASIDGQYFSKWLKTYLSSQDVIFDLHDPLPFLFQGSGILSYLNLALKQKISLLEASTYDIEWNGF